MVTKVIYFVKDEIIISKNKIKQLKLDIYPLIKPYVKEKFYKKDYH
jgi:hypothetical protein